MKDITKEIEQEYIINGKESLKLENHEEGGIRLGLMAFSNGSAAIENFEIYSLGKTNIYQAKYMGFMDSAEETLGKEKWKQYGNMKNRILKGIRSDYYDQKNNPDNFLQGIPFFCSKKETSKKSELEDALSYFYNVFKTKLFEPSRKD